MVRDQLFIILCMIHYDITELEIFNEDFFLALAYDMGVKYCNKTTEVSAIDICFNVADAFKKLDKKTKFPKSKDSLYNILTVLGEIHYAIVEEKNKPANSNNVFRKH